VALGIELKPFNFATCMVEGILAWSIAGLVALAT